MPTDRDRKMDQALPEIRKRLEDVAKLEPRWRSLFDVFEGVTADPSAGRVRVGDLALSDLHVPGLPSGVSVKEVTAAVVGSRTVETEVLLDRDTLDTLDPQTSPQVEEWAIRSAQAAALVLARDVEAAFDPAAPETSATLATLPDVIGNARQHLRRLTLDLVVSPATLSRLVGSVGKKVKEALNGGAIIPLSHLTVGQAWLLPHHGGEVVVETVDAPDLGWDTVGDDVRLFAREEFIVVRRRPLPVRRLLIECGCCGCGCCRCCRCCRCCECCVKAP